MHFINGDLISKASGYFRPGTIYPSPAHGFFDEIVQMLAAVASYGDSFAILGYITLGGALVAFFIKNKRYNNK